MTGYDPYAAVFDASSSSPSSSRPSTSSSHGPVAQEGEKSLGPTPLPQQPTQQRRHQCPPPPYSPTFRQHPSLRTTLFEPTSFDDGVVVRRLEGETLGSSTTPPPPSSPTSIRSLSAATDPNVPPVSPTRRSVTFSTSADHPARTDNNEDEEDNDKTTAVHHSRPASRSHSVERGMHQTYPPPPPPPPPFPSQGMRVVAHVGDADDECDGHWSDLSDTGNGSDDDDDDRHD
ncbi:uncharacterized protein BKCO1_1500047 [Diplodia corticola]|uniref:Uncharacterized protein n=1 Tax=Diplodia corticola TaxID=236234 RepID=A0A1J9R5E0_9PEZI|nr:uncharacterized protein BKCO1_1500047 [Diplodia corticola]OJD35769.1 hypothetical protein BKCO1_1500047 [Diplodia corticola]